jgi:hypothetical protein
LPDRPSVTVPDQIVLERDLELAGRRRELWIRRSLFALLPLVSLLALLNLFGQRPTDSQASTDAATLKLYAPEHVRSGLLYQARFPVEAHRDVRKAVLVLDPALIAKNIARERMTVDEVCESMRLEQIASVDDVECAILEGNGSISFIEKGGRA